MRDLSGLNKLSKVLLQIKMSIKISPLQGQGNEMDFKVPLGGFRGEKIENCREWLKNQ
jgi:hypothetical protein